MLNALIAEGLLGCVVGFGILAFGSVEPWAKLTLCSGALLFSGWSWYCGDWFPAQRRTKIISGLLAALSVLAIIQVVRWTPLSSPATALSTVDKAATTSAALFFAVLAAFSLAATAVLKEPARRERFRWSIAVLGSVIAMSGIIERFQGNATFYGVRPIVTGNPFVPFQNPNHAGIVLVACLFFAISGLMDSWKVHAKALPEAVPRAVLWLVAIGLMIWALAEIKSRGVFLGLGVGSAYWLSKYFDTGRRIPIAYAVIAMGVLAIVAWTAVHWGDSESYRVIFLRKAAELFVDRPFGYGFAATPVTFVPSRPWNVIGFVEHLHCDWAEFILEGGVIGGVLGGIALFGLSKEKSLYDGVGISAAAGAVAIAAHALTDFPLQIPAIALIFVLLLSIPPLPSRRRSPYRRGMPHAPVLTILGSGLAIISAFPLLRPISLAYRHGNAVELFRSKVWPFDDQVDSAAAVRDVDSSHKMPDKGGEALRQSMVSVERQLLVYPQLPAGNSLWAITLGKRGRDKDSAWFQARAQANVIFRR